MVQTQVQDAFWIVALLDQGQGHLLKHGGFTHPARSGQEHGSFQALVFQIASAGLKCQASKRRHETLALTPPGIESSEYINDFAAI